MGERGARVRRARRRRGVEAIGKPQVQRVARQLYRHALTGDLRVPATEGEGHWSGDAKEGWEFADWLNSHGIAAFVLKYRLAKAPDSKYTLPEHV